MEKPNIRSVPMSVSRSPAPSSIDLSGVPARVAEAVAQVVAVCHEQFRSDPCPEAFEEAELRVRETMNALACELLGAVIEKRDDGASRIERDGQSWFRVAATPRTIMGSVASLAKGRCVIRGLPVHLMILRWPDGPVAMPWPRSGRTVRDRRRARRSGPRRQCRPGGRTSRPGPCAARASPRSP